MGDNTDMDLKEGEDVEWLHLSQDKARGGLLWTW